LGIRRAGRTTSLDKILQSREASPVAGVENIGDLRYLKELELCSWFQRLRPSREICRSAGEVCKGNLEEWILSYWFDGAEDSRSFTSDEKFELEQLVEEVARWCGLSEVRRAMRMPDRMDWNCKNPTLRCFRLRSDPFPAVHRPLFVYFFTAVAAPLIGHRSLLNLGFRPYRSGSTEYWLRPPSPNVAWMQGREGCRPHLTAGKRPIVFCHGIGTGPAMCLPFLQLLAQTLGTEHTLFLVDTAAVSMRFADEVPGAREMASNMVDMLEVWGFKHAHFVGHSFGSFLLAWMLRYQPSYVAKCTFIDPVCFLVLKVLVEGHELQQVKSDMSMDTMEMGMKYFVMTELFVCNLMCRCFFWEESQIDMEDLAGKDTLIILESEDQLVPTRSVQRLVFAERKRRAYCSDGQEGAKLDVTWIDGQPHAGFLVDAEANMEVIERLHSFHDARPATVHRIPGTA